MERQLSKGGSRSIPAVLRSPAMLRPLPHVYQLRWARISFIPAKVSKPDFHISNTGFINAFLGFLKVHIMPLRFYKRPARFC